MRAPLRAVLAVSLLAALSGAGCRQDMHDQPRYEPLEASPFFQDGRASRPLVEGTVPRGGLQEDEIFFTGKSGEDFAGEIPVPIDMELLQRGRERYNIYCSPCHDTTGHGRGMAVRRGFPEAASFHIDRLRNIEPGYFFDVITRGFGRMPDYATQLPARDRWAIVAYVRALQVSQNTDAATLSGAERAMAESEAAPGRPEAGEEGHP